MSRNVKSTQPKVTNSKKPYCKVCFDAGKPETDYTSHWVRSLPDRSGKTTVTCPTLLNIKCGYCSRNGHTVKFCPSIKQNIEQPIKKTKTAVVETKVRENKSGTAFAALMDSDSEDEDTPVKVSKKVEDFPVLGRQVSDEKLNQPATTNWAAIAAKPRQEKTEPTNNGFVTLSDFIKIEENPEKKAVSKGKPAQWAAKTPVFTRSWAELSDSEDEDDYDTQFPSSSSSTYQEHWSRLGEDAENSAYW